MDNDTRPVNPDGPDRMTVGDLVAVIGALPPDTVVLLAGYDDRFDRMDYAPLTGITVRYSPDGPVSVTLVDGED